MPKPGGLIAIVFALALVLGMLALFFFGNRPFTESALNEGELIGVWVAEPREGSGEDDIHEMNFEIIEGTKVFNSYLHRRPEFLDCIWNLRSSTVEITCDALTDAFDIQSLTEDVLVIDREGKMITYRRFGN